MMDLGYDDTNGKLTIRWTDYDLPRGISSEFASLPDISTIGVGIPSS